MLDTDFSEDFEKISILNVKNFSDKILIWDWEKALEVELSSQENLVLWSDDSHLDNEKNKAEIVWQKNTKEWQSQKQTLKQKLEIFDAELAATDKALEITRDMRITESITVLLDSQTVINRLRHSDSESEQETMLRLWKTAQALIDDNRKINIDWILSHQEMKDNKWADQTVKKTAVRSTITSNEKVSLAYVRKAQTEIREAHKQDWLSNALRNKASEHRHRYRT